MNSKQFQELQEAYLNVYQLDENRMDSRMEKMPSAPAKVGKATHSIKDIPVSKEPSSEEKAKARKSLKLKESDLYDIILSHLIDEGYASTEEAATAIMANMSEDWRDSVVEAYKDLPVDKMIRKAGVKQFKHGMSVGSGASSNPKVAQQVGKMSATALLHDPERAKAQSKMKKD